MATYKTHLGCAMVMSALAAATVLPHKAHAALITFNYQATVYNDSPFGYPYPDVDIGDVVTGTLSYDLAAADSDLSLSTGNYGSPEGGFVVKVGLEDKTVILNFIGTQNSSSDYFQFSASVGPFEETFLAEVNLFDDEGTTFSSDALPTAFALGDFEQKDLFFGRYGNGVLNAGFRATFTEITPVPLPGAVLLLGSALALLGGMWRAKGSPPRWEG